MMAPLEAPVHNPYNAEAAAAPSDPALNIKIQKIRAPLTSKYIIFIKMLIKEARVDEMMAPGEARCL